MPSLALFAYAKYTSRHLGSGVSLRSKLSFFVVLSVPCTGCSLREFALHRSSCFCAKRGREANGPHGPVGVE
jgi:hypothetical protein